MDGFIYFVPAEKWADSPQTDAERIRACFALGIGYAFDKAPLIRRIKGTGPDGGPGFLFHDGRIPMTDARPSDAGIKWRQDPITGVYVGWRPDALPKPGDLQRTEIMERNHARALGDGRLWLCPVALFWMRGDEGRPLRPVNGLPREVDLDAAGRFVPYGMTERDEWLWTVAAQWHDLRHQIAKGEIGDEIEAPDADADEVRVTFEFENLTEHALFALQTNYRIGRVEVIALRLFSKYGAQRVLDALIDLPTVNDWVKKNLDHVTLCSAHGDPD